MAFIHGKYTKVLFGDADLSQYFNSTSRTTNVEQADATTYGRGHKAYLAGVQDGALSLGGLFDGDAGAIDEKLSGILGTTGINPVTVLLTTGAPAVNDRVFLASAVATSYNVSSPVSDIVSANSEFVTSAGIHSGRLLHPGTAITATGNGTSVDLGALPASSPRGWVANLHVLDTNTMDDDVTFTIEDSANNSTWASLGSFTAVAAGDPSGQSIELIPDVVNRYVRVVRTVAGTGSITAYVSFARIL